MAASAEGTLEVTSDSSASEDIVSLVRLYKENATDYQAGGYKEARARNDLIDRLFIALEWDVRNDDRKGELDRDVVLEDTVEVEGRAKAPDYCFRIDQKPRFYVEAKKPSVEIKENSEAAYQLRRYCWSATLPVGVLTNFREFSVYDGRKPKDTDSASVARLLYLTYDEYPSRWQEISGLFSPPAIRGGSLDRLAETSKTKRGSETVDAAFLTQLEGWRKEIARVLALRNTGLSQRDLNFAVQSILDRIIFLRIAEDRDIEPYGRLKTLTKVDGVYARLVEFFQLADARYNSGLFHFSDERDQIGPPDRLTLGLEVDDKTLKEIIDGLYYSRSPYEFSVIPGEILGAAYEQFLGKVIRLTPGHQAKVEEKPEVRKAGGVYYTPKYVVDYLVNSTVRPLVQGRKPGELGSIRILDPACGSGSFLLGAYKFLIDWYRESYIRDGPRKHQGKLVRGKGAAWYLSSSERRRILLDHIFGVDVDPQAVEVTKLSLLLEVLRDETKQNLDRNQKLFHQRALPDLAGNIKCGNSVVGPDFMPTRQTTLLEDDEERIKINAFEWEVEFPTVFTGQNRGFDVVIGNPPYVFGRDWKSLGISGELKHYLGATYPHSPYQLDMFSIFMEKAMGLARQGGYVGQIVPNVWLNNTYSSATRSFVLQASDDLTFTTPPPDVFPAATVDTVIYSLRKAASAAEKFEVRTLRTDGSVSNLGSQESRRYLDGKTPIPLGSDEREIQLVTEIQTAYPTLGSFASVTRGVHPYRTGGYGRSAFGRGTQTERDVEERPYHSTQGGEGYRPFIYGKDLLRLTPPVARDFVRYGPWLAEPREPEFFTGERVYSRKILGDRLVVTVETEDSVSDQQVYISKPKPGGPSAFYLAGVMGSRLMGFYIRKFYHEEDNAFPQIKVGQLRDLPIPSPRGKNETTAKEVAELVQSILAKRHGVSTQESQPAQTFRVRELAHLERELEARVRSLFDITESEALQIDSQSNENKGPGPDAGAPVEPRGDLLGVP